MKKPNHLVACVCLCWLMLAAQANTQDRLTVRAGDEVPICVQPALLSEGHQPSVDLAQGSSFWVPGPERYVGWALRDLSNYLQKMTNARFPLVATDTSASQGIFVGSFDEFADFQPQQLESKQAIASADPEAFVVQSQGAKLYILGKSNLGVIAGIYSLLDELGCKWFAPGQKWENVPTLQVLNFNDQLNLASSGPSYQSRLFFPSWGPNRSVLLNGQRETEYTLWNLRNRMGGSAYTANFHNDPGMIPPTLFQTRPELFALVDGTRNSYALSRANPDTIEMAIESAVKYLREHEGQGSYYNSFSVETNDGSPACQWSLQQVGNHTATDLNYWFANQIAAGLDKAGLGDKWVGMCSYSDHAGVPSFDIHPRVAVQLTTGLDFSSGMTIEQRLEGLRARGARRIGVYHYLNLLTWSLDRPGGHPASNPNSVAADLKRWHEKGASTYMAETSDSWINGGPGHYVVSRILWDVQSDSVQILDEYFDEAFGPAAAPIRALHEDWVKYQGQILPRIQRGSMAKWHDLISSAEQRVKDDATLRMRINDVKRYYLYLNYLYEFNLDIVDSRLPSREERFVKLLRYVGSNRGEGAFHAIGLLPVLFMYSPPAGMVIDPAKLGPEFLAISKNINDESAWKSFAPLDAAEIDRLFNDSQLSIGGKGPGAAALDTVVNVFPADAKPANEIVFPKLHGPPVPDGPRHYTFMVTAATPKLSFRITADNPLGGGSDNRTCTLADDSGNELRSLSYQVGEPVEFEVANVRPGLYALICADFGAEQVTITGANLLGAVRVLPGDWGFNPFRPKELPADQPFQAYFLVPAGQTSLKLRLTAGDLSFGFVDGEVISSGVRGNPQYDKQPLELHFVAADGPRIAYAKWHGEFLLSQGMIVEGVNYYSFEPSHVLYETLAR